MSQVLFTKVYHMKLIYGIQNLCEGWGNNNRKTEKKNKAKQTNKPEESEPFGNLSRNTHQVCFIHSYLLCEI